MTLRILISGSVLADLTDRVNYRILNDSFAIDYPDDPATKDMQLEGTIDITYPRDSNGNVSTSGIFSNLEKLQRLQYEVSDPAKPAVMLVYQKDTRVAQTMITKMRLQVPSNLHLVDDTKGINGVSMTLDVKPKWYTAIHTTSGASALLVKESFTFTNNVDYDLYPTRVRSTLDPIILNNEKPIPYHYNIQLRDMVSISGYYTRAFLIITDNKQDRTRYTNATIVNTNRVAGSWTIFPSYLTPAVSGNGFYQVFDNPINQAFNDTVRRVTLASGTLISATQLSPTLQGYYYAPSGAIGTTPDTLYPYANFFPLLYDTIHVIVRYRVNTNHAWLLRIAYEIYGAVFFTREHVVQYTDGKPVITYVGSIQPKNGIPTLKVNDLSGNTANKYHILVKPLQAANTANAHFDIESVLFVGTFQKSATILMFDAQTPYLNSNRTLDIAHNYYQKSDPNIQYVRDGNNIEFIPYKGVLIPETQSKITYMFTGTFENRWHITGNPFLGDPQDTAPYHSFMGYVERYIQTIGPLIS
jgi:hypothetical protein